MRIALYCVSIVLFTAAAQAGNSQPSPITLLVNQGEGFKPATDRMVIRPGDRVMALASERVEIVYSNASCKLTIQPGAVVIVPLCDKTALAPPSKLGGCSENDDPDPCRIEREGEHDDWLLIVGGAVALGVGAVLLLESDHGASP